MQIEVGAILEGKVTGITKFSAFVELPSNKTGMVHISEIAPVFVNDIHDFVKEDQIVKVKVLSISEDGKIALSMKKAVEAPPRPAKRENQNFNNRRPRTPKPITPAPDRPNFELQQKARYHHLPFHQQRQLVFDSHKKLNLFYLLHEDCHQ